VTDRHDAFPKSECRMSIGGELTFVKFSKSGLLETANLHSQKKYDLAILFAQNLSLEFGGRIATKAEKEISGRSFYAKIDFEIPPRDNTFGNSKGLGQIIIRPDVDVIEINLQPSVSIEYVEMQIMRIYSCAFRIGLKANRTGSENCSGTRGGFHLTFSCPGTDVSARTATLNLALGLIELTHKWPFLSFLFCGDRSGPDGFHPRMDELSNDVQERIRVMRNIAKTYRDRGSDDPNCWSTSATAMMHLMRDRFGHSHIVEISLDKLWSSDPSRNLGTVELRQFEMPDTADLAIAQARFAWSIASAVNSGYVKTGDFSSERSNPDIMDRDLLRFFSLYRIDRFGSKLTPLLLISENKFPSLEFFSNHDVRFRLRRGKAEYFCEYVEKGSELREIFIPFKIHFSIKFFSKNADFIDDSILSLTLNLHDGFFDLRNFLLDKARRDDRDLIDAATASVERTVSLVMKTINWRDAHLNGHRILIAIEKSLANERIKIVFDEFLCFDIFTVSTPIKNLVINRER
jgi:hypothetical protein